MVSCDETRFPPESVRCQHGEDSHRFCRRCNEDFTTEEGLKEHYVQSMRHHYCQLCDQDFDSGSSLKKHYVKSGRHHHYCQLCDQDFDLASDLKKHNDDEHRPCKFCGIISSSSLGLHQHYINKHSYCAPCGRLFINGNNLRMHLNSAVHKLKDVHCPMANCKGRFVSLAALFLHLDTNTCPSRLTCDNLNLIVVRIGPNKDIKIAQLINELGGNAPAPVTTSGATEPWNGYGHECSICHNTFDSLHALDAHLKSPRHKKKIYRCPNHETCDLKFSVLGALAQHMESGKCGMNTSEYMQPIIDLLSSDMPSISDLLSSDMPSIIDSLSLDMGKVAL